MFFKKKGLKARQEVVKLEIAQEENGNFVSIKTINPIISKDVIIKMVENLLEDLKKQNNR